MKITHVSTATAAAMLAGLLATCGGAPATTPDPTTVGEMTALESALTAFKEADESLRGSIIRAKSAEGATREALLIQVQGGLDSQEAVALGAMNAAVADTDFEQIEVAEEMLVAAGVDKYSGVKTEDLESGKSVWDKTNWTVIEQRLEDDGKVWLGIQHTPSSESITPTASEAAPADKRPSNEPRTEAFSSALGDAFALGPDESWVSLFASEPGA